MPTVSVIIPCYNLGKFVEEAVDSVLASTFTDFEIIIVNDGSTDKYTNTLLSNFKKPKVKVITTPNQGVVKARNTAVQNSSGRYVLPLDADDKISADYMSKAVKLLDENPKLGIVYCKAQMFGQDTGEWLLPEYTIEGMLSQCLIFVTGFFRREDFDAIGGWDPEMTYYYEDWDFWLSVIERGREVYRIPEYHFFYRIVETSRTRTRDWKEEKKLGVVTQRLYKKHVQLYVEHFQNPISLYSQLQKNKAASEEHIKWIYNTTDYKLGHLLLKPLRFVKRLFKFFLKR